MNPERRRALEYGVVGLWQFPLGRGVAHLLNNGYRTLLAGPRIYGDTRELVLLLPMHVKGDEMGWDQKRYTQLI